MAKKKKKTPNKKYNGTNSLQKIRSVARKKSRQRRANTNRKNKARKKPVKLVSKTAKVSKKIQKHGRKSVKASKVSKKAKRNRSKKITASKSRSKTVRSSKKSGKQKGKINDGRTPKRRTPTPKQLPVKRITALDYRGDVSYFLQIDLSKYRNFQQKISAINLWVGNGVEYFLNKDKLFPRAFMVILTTFKKGKTKGEKNERFERANIISPPDMEVNITNIKKLILEYMVAFQDNFLEYIDGSEGDSDWVYDPAKIIAVSIRFFYG